MSQPAALVFDSHGRLTDVNEAFFDLWPSAKGLLRLGAHCGDVLDFLRRSDCLPTVVDYHGWRSMRVDATLGAINRKDWWQLDDGRIIDGEIRTLSGRRSLHTFLDVTAEMTSEVVAPRI